MIEAGFTDVLKTAISTFFVPPTSSIIAGMTYGIKSGLDYQTYKNIKTAGLSHLIVFSGSNIVIIYSIILQSIVLLKSKVRILTACVLMIAFLALLPKEPTIMRASIMWGFNVISTLIDKKASRIYTLLLTVVIMVFIDPSVATSISFQLSVSAILGILIFNKVDSEKTTKNLLNNIKNDLKTTISAQVFTIPIIYYYFGEFNPFSPISNLLISPIVRPIIYVGILTPILHILSINKAIIITYCGNILIQILLFVVNIFS